MKKITLFITLIVFTLGFSQAIPVTFDTDITVGAKANGILTPVSANWFSDSGLTSVSVEDIASDTPDHGKAGKIISSASGAKWQNAQILLQNNYIDLRANKKITLDVYSDKAQNFLLKMEQSKEGTTGNTEKSFSHTGAGWESITVDFSTPDAGQPVPNDQYRLFVIFPCYSSGFADPAFDSTTYIDNFSGTVGDPITISNYNLEDIDFESSGFGANWAWTIHNNHTNPALEIVDNPNASGINTTAKVAKFTSLNQGAAWALTFTDNIGSFKFDQNNKIVTLMVRKSVKSDVAIKFEIAGTGTHVEKKRANTISDGSWEQLTFDFSSEIGNSYNRLVIIPDFANRSQDNVSYFDQLSFGSTANLNEIWIDHNFKVFPNPAKDTVQFSVNSNENLDIEIFDMLGKSVLRVNAVRNEVNIADLNSGLYFVQMTLGTQQATKKLVVN